MLYELINQSDYYTLECGDLEAAALACLLLGEGDYGLKPLTGEGDGMPLFTHGGHDKWFTEHFGRTVEESLNHVPYAQLADALESVVIGDRKKYLSGLAAARDPAEFAIGWNDLKRSSLNNIGAKAKKLAAALRAKAV